MNKALNIIFVFGLCLSHHCLAQKLTLQQAINEAIGNNPGLLKAAHEIESANAGLWEAILPDNPHFFTEYEEIPRKSHSLSDYGDRSIGFVQEFEFPLAYYYRKKRYNYSRKLPEFDYLQLRNEVAVNVKKSFYKVLLLEKKKQLYENSAQLTYQLYEKARIRVEAGESASYDTLRVKVDLADVENTILAIEKEYDAAWYELKLLLGRRKEETIEIDGELQFKPVKVYNDSLKTIAMTNHPHLRQVLTTVNKREIERKLSWMEFSPKFELKYFRQNFRDKPVSKAWGGEIGLTIPIWSILKGNEQRRATFHELEAARWLIEVQKRKILLDVQDAFSNLVVAEKRVENYRENILLEIEELVRIVTRSYEEGEMDYLEVTEAMRTMNRINAGYLDTLYEYLSAQADLEKAVGESFFEN